MHEVKVIEGRTGNGAYDERPFMVEVDGKLLLTARGNARRFSTSFAASLAGAKEVDRQRAQDNGN